MPNTIFHTSKLSPKQQQQVQQQLECELRHRGDFYVAVHEFGLKPADIGALRQSLECDVNSLADSFDASRIGLLVTDMDSTLINIECIDEIADFVGIKPQIAKITESAMRGEIDFSTSLQRRVALLKGLDSSALEEVYQNRLRLNPGAESLMATLKDRGVKRALVSGGFTFFTQRLEQRLNLDFTLANKLDIENSKLTGKVLGDIVDGKRKMRFLLDTAEQLQLSNRQTIAVGDGANDLPMLEQAGLSVAYHAKPVVQERADVVLNHCGLDAILHLLEAAG